MYKRHLQSRLSRVSRFAMAVGLLSAVLAGGCLPEEAQQRPRLVLFLGIDVSGSFQNTGNYNDALRFAAHYIYGHMQALGELEKPSVLYVGSIGGERPGEAKSFHPIHDFQGKSVDEIEVDLRKWFQPDDAFTDFNVFFERVADFVKRQNLTLKPIAIVVISDGVPDVTTRAAAQGGERYKRINLEPLEYLSRNVTVRLLYANPEVAVNWEQDVPRNRVRMWTVDDEVMVGWRRQINLGDPVDEQERLWTWIKENVDFRVRRSIL